MNPYVIAGLAAVAFFLLRPQGAPAGSWQAVGGGAGGAGGSPRTTKGGARTGVDDALAAFGASGIDQAIEDQVNAITAAIERGKKEEAARREQTREQIATTRADQATSLADLGTGAAVKRLALSPRRSMTDFGA